MSLVHSSTGTGRAFNGLIGLITLTFNIHNLNSQSLYQHLSGIRDWCRFVTAGSSLCRKSVKAYSDPSIILAKEVHLFLGSSTLSQPPKALKWHCSTTASANWICSCKSEYHSWPSNCSSKVFTPLALYVDEFLYLPPSTMLTIATADWPLVQLLWNLSSLEE